MSEIALEVSHSHFTQCISRQEAWKISRSSLKHRLSKSLSGSPVFTQDTKSQADTILNSCLSIPSFCRRGLVKGWRGEERPRVVQPLGCTGNDSTCGTCLEGTFPGFSHAPCQFSAIQEPGGLGSDLTCAALSPCMDHVCLASVKPWFVYCLGLGPHW